MVWRNVEANRVGFEHENGSNKQTRRDIAIGRTGDAVKIPRQIYRGLLAIGRGVPTQ
jgi:hypothetical protein